jgi:uncharacterized damage-inducible protein DinB
MPDPATTSSPSAPEPWLRGTLTDVPAVARAVLHALELAREDLHKWCDGLTDGELNAGLANLPPVAFQLRHIARSIDRLLTYAESRRLDADQLSQLKSEQDRGATREALFRELSAALDAAAKRVRALANSNLDEPRTVGGRALPTTLGGLLVHVADHTQRHVGQVVATVKVLLAHRR